MDNLRHIDTLLKSSLEQYHQAKVLDSDWHAIELKLKQRKNRITMVWFSLALILVSAISIPLIYPLINTDHAGKYTQADPHKPVENQANSDLDKIQPEKAQTQQQSPRPEIQVQKSLDKPDKHIVMEEGNYNQSNGRITEENTKPLKQEETEVLDTDIDENKDADRIVDKPALEEDALVIDEVPELKEDIAVEQNTEKVKDAVSQTKDITKVKKGHFEYGISFTPAMSGKWLGKNPENAWRINRSYMDIAQKSESLAFSSNASLNIEYHFPNAFFIGTGFGIADRSETVNYNYQITQHVIVNETSKTLSYGPLPPPLHKAVQYSGSNSYHFIEIPLTLGYSHSIVSRWQWRNQADISYMLMYRRNGMTANYTHLTLRNLKDLNELNSSTLSASIKSGIYYNFNNFVFGAEPIVGMNLTSLSDKSSALKIKPYNYGFNFTTNIKLNRN